ncbi:MAG: hypothetical protein WKF84_19485 [Pyrinomonadaceae bacterium]
MRRTQFDTRAVGVFVTHLPEFEAEIRAHRNTDAATYGIEPAEQLSEAARAVAPAAGLAEDDGATQSQSAHRCVTFPSHRHRSPPTSPD